MYLASVHLLFIDICFSVLFTYFIFIYLFCIWRVYLNAARNSVMPFEYNKATLYYHCMTEVTLHGLTANLPPSLKPWMLRELYV